MAMFASHVEDLIAAKQQGVRFRSLLSLSLLFFNGFFPPLSCANDQVPLVRSSTLSISAARPRIRVGVMASRLSPKGAKST